MSEHVTELPVTRTDFRPTHVLDSVELGVLFLSLFVVGLSVHEVSRWALLRGFSMTALLWISALWLIIVDIGLFLLKPEVFRNFTLSMDVRDAFIGLAVGALCAFPLAYLSSSIALTATNQKPTLFVITVFLAPVVEELLFRWIVLEALLVRFSPVVAVLLTSLLFTLGHSSFVSSFAASLVFSVVYVWRQHKIGVSILSHAAWNATVFLFFARVALHR